MVGILSFYAHPPTGYGRVLRDTAGRVIGLISLVAGLFTLTASLLLKKSRLT